MNLIQNPDFADGMTGWMFHASGGGSFAVVDGEARLTVNAPGDNVQFYQAGLTLKPATRYRLAFRASSNDGSNLIAFIHQHTAPYTSYGLNGPVAAAGVEPQLFETVFTTPDAAENLTDGRLRFWLAPYARARTVYTIDDVSLAEAADEPEPTPEPEPLPDLSRQISVIVRDIPPGGSHEVRHVRPADLVVRDGDIVWSETPFTAYILAAPGEPEPDENSD